MTGKQKDRLINAALGIVTGCSVVLFGVFANNKNDNEAAIKKAVESKLDVTEYEADQLQRWNNHDAIEAQKQKREDDMYEMVKYLYQNQGGKLSN